MLPHLHETCNKRSPLRIDRVVRTKCPVLLLFLEKQTFSESARHVSKGPGAEVDQRVCSNPACHP